MKIKYCLAVSVMASLLLANVSCCRMCKTKAADHDGWVELFNGRDLTHWRQSGCASWQVEDGLLVGRQGAHFAAGDLFSEKVYEDFELVCTWKVTWPCNSGIWFRYQDPGKAFQADILEYGDPVAYAGSIYCPGKLFIAINDDQELVDREGWNTIRIRAVGDHLQVWLNGRQVADVHDSTSARGRVGIQVHPGEVFGDMSITVKEFKIKPL